MNGIVEPCSEKNQAAQPLKMARGLKFRIQEVVGLYYPCSENKGADQLLRVFVFTFAKSRFSHNAAQIEVTGIVHSVKFTRCLYIYLQFEMEKIVLNT